MRHFNIEEVKPNIFHFLFKDSRKMSLHFVRFEELYESNLKGIRNSKFTLVQFIEEYSKKYSKDKHTFTYMNDWGGFNVPDYIFDLALSLGHYKDFTEYDNEMISAVQECKDKSQYNKIYIIGSCGKNGYLRHEIAHGMWYTNAAYKKEMSDLILTLDKTKKKNFYKALTDLKYCKEVLPDEAQAYLSTGLCEELYNIFDKSIEKKFKKIFNKYYKG